MARIIQASAEVVKPKLESPAVTVIFLFPCGANRLRPSLGDQGGNQCVSELVELAREVKKRAR
jgi:hypothetical protein